MDCSTLRMIIVSVTSSSMWRGSAPTSRTIASSVDTSRRDMNWRGEMLIEMVIGGRPSSCQRFDCWHAVRKTHSPIGTMRPSSSATKTKSFGKISPFCGSFQRISASMPEMRPGGDVHLRLVAQEEFLVLDRLAQPPLDLQALGEQEIQVVGEEADRVAAGVLRLVHRVVGVLEQLVHVGRVVRIVADADRRRHVDLVPADLHRARELLRGSCRPPRARARGARGRAGSSRTRRRPRARPCRPRARRRRGAARRPSG